MIVVAEAVRLYTVSDAADVIGMSAEWVRRQIVNGTLRAVELGSGRSKRRVRADDLQAFIDARSFGGAA